MSLIAFFASTIKNSWRSIAVSPLIPFRSIAFGDDTWVIVGDTASSKNVAYSTDNGETWNTALISAQTSWYDVAYGENVFVACAPSGTAQQLVYSTDGGVTWSNCIRSGWTFTTYALRAITYGNGIFVCPAYSIGPNPPGVVLISSDGITFTEVSTGVGYCEQVEYGNSLFMLGSFSGFQLIRTSSDGINWTTRTYPETGLNIISLRFLNGYFYCIMTGNIIKRSVDGISWETLTSPSAFTISDIAYGNGAYIVSGDSTISTESASIASTTDFVTWYKEVTPINTALSRIKFDNGVFITTSFDNPTKRIFKKP